MMTSNKVHYRSRWVFPMDRPPIHDGVIQVVDGTIAAVGPTQQFAVGSKQPNVIDLGDVAVLPKLVNAHTHLEFSDCREVIGDAGIHLANWIGEVIRARGQVDSAQRDVNVRQGLVESEEAGVGLIGDIATTPTRYPVSTKTHLVSFAEVLGLSEERGQERLEAANQHFRSLEPNQQVCFGVSPHAPYSTPTALLDAAIDVANQHGSPVAMHVAESPEERVLLESGEGPFADSLKSAGLWREGLFPYPQKDAVIQVINRLGTASRSLLVHGNDLREDEINAIAKTPGMSVVYCPRTHAFFGYDAHPVNRLLAAGIPVALGTDSRASNPDLNLWSEVQFLLNHRQDLSPESVLEMATLAGARALRGESTFHGRIVAGKRGGIDGLITVKTNADVLDRVYLDFADQSCQCMKLFDQA